MRTVRQCFLCGFEPLAQRDFHHRRSWFYQRLEELAPIDEGAILACSIDIDLNEIRAELAEMPEDSTHTSAYRRILARLLRRERAAQDGAQGGSLRATDYQARIIHGETEA